MQSPMLPPGKVERIGNPWHGAVKSGSLTLAVNAAAKTWPQPDLPTTSFRDGFPYYYGPGPTPPYPVWEPDRFGFTSRLAFSGAAASLPPADAVSGKQWLDEALLSGPRRQLYGHDLGGWMWQRADGSVWHVASNLDERALHDWTVPLDIVFTFTPGARFTSETAAAQTETLTVSDFGQTAQSVVIGVIDNAPGTADGDDYDGVTYRKCWLTIVDISGTGRYAIVEVSSAYRIQSDVYELGAESDYIGITRGVLAYLQIDLGSGGGAPSVSMLKTRDQVFNAVSPTNGPVLAEYKGRLLRACYSSAGIIVYFEYKVVFSDVYHVTASWIRRDSAGTELDSISVSFENFDAYDINCSHPLLAGGHATLVKNPDVPGAVDSTIEPAVWSNNLVGFVHYEGLRAAVGVFSGQLMTADGPVTVADKPLIQAPAFGSYCPYSALGGLSARVRFGEASPVCWV